ncbi:hypothetical protein [Nostoc sp. MG11]|uniref:hypothetical protein n=1 Tax=Nostoc sp. MG11 TaxID=2721166 RepID=UPI001866093D|nr:hypothetical protein [Nostoc sp. MG11]
MMRSPTVGACTIAQGLHLLTFGRQVIVRFEVLHPNGVLAIPKFYGATEIIYYANNRPTPTLAPECGIVLG